MTGFIYVITNDINGKQYVGKTTNTIAERFSEHLQDYKKSRCEKRPLYDAMKKYGIEHFSIKQLEECPFEILAEKEQYWINKLNTYHIGYNATHGGDGKILYDHHAFIDEYKQGLTIKEIANKYQCCRDIVSAAIKSAGLDSNQNAINKQKTIPIIQRDLNNEIIQEFNSTQAAARWLIEHDKTHTTEIKCVTANLLKAARKTNNIAYKFKWNFAHEEDKQATYNKTRPVLCIDTGEQFDSASDAMKWCGLKSNSGIRANCAGDCKSAGKHPVTGEKLHWRYVENPHDLIYSDYTPEA